jgi:hypothetical protein
MLEIRCKHLSRIHATTIMPDVKQQLFAVERDILELSSRHKLVT